MSRHYVGNVITYMPPPEHEQTEVDIPIDSQSEQAPLSSFLQLPEESLTGASSKRLNEITSQNDLSLSTLRRNRGFDPGHQLEAARYLAENPTSTNKFAWSGAPENDEARAVLSFGFEFLLSRRQKRGMSFNRLWGLLNSVRYAEGNWAELVTRQERYKRADQDLSDVIADIFSFQRNWMGYTIPSLLRATQLIYNEIATSLGAPLANYEFYRSQIESLFLNPGILDLDEYGLPLPLALRFSGLGMAEGPDLETILQSFVVLAQDPSVRQGLNVVELWIVDDVLEGLGY